MLPTVVLLGLLPATPRTFTDPIHKTITLHPLCVAIADTPEFQRLRGVGQLGLARHVFPGAVHDRFQHALGVSHLAYEWARHFQKLQPELKIDERDVLCVSLAGLLHDLGHGPFSHFWEHVPWSTSSGSSAAQHVKHEDISCAMIERLLERNSIDTAPWLADGDIKFVQALIRGSPPSHESCSSSSSSSVYRTGQAGVLGEDKRFLYDIVANQRNGFDVDKLDYFERDSHFAGVVKVSFDR